MKKTTSLVILVIAISFFPSLALSIEPAPRITDREVVEKLASLAEGQQSTRREMDARFEAIDKRFESIEFQIKQLREDMKEQNKQLREDMNLLRQDMNSHFNRLSAMFVALFVAIIGFALWDRRTMIRPFETKVKEIEEKISVNHAKLHSLLETLRALSKTDAKVAEVLRSFNLL